MLNYLPAIFAVFAAAAGWHYLFYSKAALRLDGIESPIINTRRKRLRRTNGIALLLLGAGFYVGFKIDADTHPGIFVGLWAGELFLLLLVVILAMIDIRLTARLRRKS